MTGETMDYTTLQALTLGDRGVEEPVSVNQRALVDKILARYASENTTLRELLQNSDDANATSVEIHYETKSKLPLNPTTLQRTRASRLILKNNGFPFRDQDWSRLKRIAEGNADESKIGAFGVGFYSVFSVCEDPFVSSGGECMAFYWGRTEGTKDQLFARRAKVGGEHEKDGWTTFVLNMREEMELPNLPDLCRFLTTSLTFARSLANISLFFDSKPLITISRISSPSSTLSLPTTLKYTCPQKMLNLQSVASSAVQISVEYLNAVLYKPDRGPDTSFRGRFLKFVTAEPEKPKVTPDWMARTQATAFLRVATASISCSVKPSYAQNLSRATKKPPPKQTSLSLLCINKDEYAASSVTDPVFRDLVSFPNQGRCFIGFPTHQTTGVATHLAAPGLIPTVERESVDLVDPFIKIWNFEMLYAAGILARIVYHTELAALPGGEAGWERAIHTMQLFTVHGSTPSAKIGQSIEEAFHECSKNYSVPIVSTQGVLPSSEVRLLGDSKITFLEKVPVVPRVVEEAKGASAFLDRMVEMGLIAAVGVEDVVRELEARPFGYAQVNDLLGWMGGNAMTLQDKQRILNVAVAVAEDGSVYNLGKGRWFLNAKVIPEGWPVPLTCVPYALTKKLDRFALEMLGWEELDPLSWVKWICDTKKDVVLKDLEGDKEFAVTVLGVVSRQWESLSPSTRGGLVALLRGKRCVPTRNGMMKPEEAYFHTVNLFQDLPVIETMKGVKEKVLIQLGVRKTVELQIVFDRLFKGGEWSHVELITYLTGVKDDIPKKEIERLKKTPMCTAEGDPTKRYLASDLHEPNDTLRALGLPILQWKTKENKAWKPLSDEARFLYMLGLRKYPTVDKILELAASEDVTLRNNALAYFIAGYTGHGYVRDYKPANVQHAFCPAEPDVNGVVKLYKPTMVFTQPLAAMFGFPVLRRDLWPASLQLGVKADPPIDKVVNRLLQNPPVTTEIARVQFEYLAGRTGDMAIEYVNQLSNANIVPIATSTGKIKHVAPNTCFLNTQSSEASFYREIFSYVDFGSLANAFLKHVGTKLEPTQMQIAEMLVKSPGDIYRLAQTDDKYLSLLRQLAINIASLRKNRGLFEQLKQRPFLLAHKVIPASDGAQAGDDDEDDMQSHVLAAASDIVIVDDFVSYNHFKSDLLAAPQEDALESFYEMLGASRVSNVIKENHRVAGIAKATQDTEELRKLINERTSLFLHETSEAVAYDAKWLARCLRVVMVDKIQLQRTMQFGTRVSTQAQTTSAFVQQIKGAWQLNVTPNWDFYDIAQALCKLLLVKSKVHDPLLFTSLLTTDLKLLRRRGYNVDRILANKEEARKLAEQKRQKDLEEHEKALAIEAVKEKEREKERSIQVEGTPRTPQKPIPGAFPESTGKHTLIQTPSGHQESQDLYGKLRRKLGWGGNTDNTSVGTLDHRPSNSNTDMAPIHKGTVEHGPLAAPAEKVTSTAKLEQTLRYAVSASHPADAKQLVSPPTMTTVKEAVSTYCDSSSGHNSRLVGEVSGIRFYVSEDVPDEERDNALAYFAKDLRDFVDILKRLAGVFDCEYRVFNIFYDKKGPNIAFNRGGTIYCNLRYYLQLHAGDAGRGKTSDAVVYWYVSLAHEFAHNLVQEHSAGHSFYTESLISQYFGRVVPLLAGPGQLQLEN
ncbi:hypothetical protein G7K_2843-t1 [Saitoella complicata NRRL Y-17804]|uniref:Sacsin/Nov domain-containing protein n=1 Tax=Saitoella complicata (strain BCRC 22490 / CBS 7301 / JCM 7358 / NBRC 10748 / NRRL Y-17804) TaxID=698492 RepID=A0A0E9NFT1_SAICN|nr:hypothetical protein G7K_2843-t1 [Saitoella complicata NRRL Y-17804]